MLFWKELRILVKHYSIHGFVNNMFNNIYVQPCKFLSIFFLRKDKYSSFCLFLHQIPYPFSYVFFAQFLNRKCNNFLIKNNREYSMCKCYNAKSASSILHISAHHEISTRKTSLSINFRTH